MKRKSVYFIAKAAIIATLYATLTVLQNVLVPGSASAAVQFRVSEVLTILALYTPAAIPGLTVGCIIANAVGVATGANIAGWLDVLLGSLATLMAAICTRMLRDVKVMGIPLLALLPPVIFNALIVGAELSLFIPEGDPYWFCLLTDLSPDYLLSLLRREKGGNE